MIRFLTALSLLIASPAYAIVLDNGLLNVFDATNPVPDGNLSVLDGPSGPTTARVLEGGIAGDFLDGLQAAGFSRIEYSNSSLRFTATGGSLSDDSEIVFGAGAAFSFFVEDRSHLRLAGGTWLTGGDIRDSASLTMTDGRLLDSGSPVNLFGSASVSISGGTISARLWMNDSTTGEITGGNHGDAEALVSTEVRDDAVLRIVGSSFNLPFGEVTALSGQIFGTLADGGGFTRNFERDATATILLVPIPEPGTAVLVLLGLTALGVNARRLN